jgi:multiple antibiotic resistance protein
VDDLAFLAAVTVSVFALVDPLGALPFFVSLTEGFSAADRKIVLGRAVAVLGGILTTFAVVGRFLFAGFGFTLAAFEIAGGIVLFLVAVEMVTGETRGSKMTESERSESLARRDEVSIVPLGIPLLAGPGAISTVMIYEGNAGTDPFAILSVFVAIAATTAVTWVVLTYGQRILRAVGRVGVMALTRVMGLLLAAVGVQFVINGLVHVAPLL